MRRSVGGAASVRMLVSRLLLTAAGALLLLLLGSWSAHADEGSKATADPGEGGALGAVTRSVTEVADGAGKQVAQAARPVADAVEKVAARPTSERPAADSRARPDTVQRTVDLVRETTDVAAGAARKTTERAAGGVTAASRSLDHVVEQVPVVRDVVPHQAVSRTTAEVTRPLRDVAGTADRAVRDVGKTVDAVVTGIDRRETVDTPPDVDPDPELPPTAAPVPAPASSPAQPSTDRPASVPATHAAPADRPVAGPTGTDVRSPRVDERRVASAPGVDPVLLRNKWVAAPTAVAASDERPPRPVGVIADVANQGPSTAIEAGRSGGSPAVPAAPSGGHGGESSAGSSGAVAPVASFPDSAGRTPHHDLQVVLRGDWPLGDSPAFEPGTSPG